MSTWHLVKETPRVMGFIGGKADQPAPISRCQKHSDDSAAGASLVVSMLRLKLCLSRASWFAWSMGRSTTSMGLLKK